MSWYGFSLLFYFFFLYFIIQIDIDECATGIANCHFFATCTNTQGSFSCQCEEGYFGDGFSCNNEGLFLSLFDFFSTNDFKIFY